MASSSKVESDSEDEALDEEVEHFDDFTLASSWERFISEIEAVCRQWMSDGPKNLLEKGAVLLEFSKNLYKVKFELKYALKSYLMEYYFEKSNTDDGKVSDWNFNLHDLQLCFGVKEFLVIAPQSASGVVLDAPEASKLLSAVAIALSNCSSLLPAFVPVHDPSRKAYIGIQNRGTVFTRRFESDHIGSQVPVKLMHLEGLYELFISKFAYSTLDISVHLFKVHFTMKLTYRTLSFDDDNDVQETDAEMTESEGNPASDIHSKAQWDDDCPWSEWYSAEDPVKGFEVIAIWSEKMVESSSEMAELENASPHDAEKWILFPIFSENLTDGSKGNQIGFASQLHFLVDALDMSFEAQFMEDFVSVESQGPDNLKTSMVIPPPTVIDRMLKELFHEGVQEPNFAKSEHKNSRAIKGAPLESLFAQFCLHSLWVDSCNIRAIAVLWIEFVREVRWCWEESQPLPKMPANGSIDLSTCLINQKLQMLAICIESKRELNEDYQDCIGSTDQASPHKKEDDPFGEDSDSSSIMLTPGENFDGKRDSPSKPDDLHGSGTTVSKFSSEPEHMVLADPKPSDCIRRGSAGVVGSMMLLKSHQRMHTPCTQDAPLMTEDMHEERLRAVEAFGDSFNFSAQLEKEILSTDMSAFKAANPDAIFEDFIRWHSPGDWESDDTQEKRPIKRLAMEDSNNDWPPRGRLSRRMSEHGNLWRKIWNDAPALPASEQKPLLDPNREGEKDFDKKQQVRIHERPVVSNMFTPPTANQSWRKVLSMGNNLNGHEPVLREIIFSIRDRVSDHYAAHIPSVYQQEIETYRMYTCGTSNDLRVALSVVSCD
ncbi:hypothetical protein RGQ29_000333 [Quercus rubra]|uniref:Rab3 GTPase-activating protein catalytic subunit n=1 Tax=Quercus rubra TaxID=3512 RepID=A0AAN7G5J5_QUERU|nr:hypothetical protein RGQ29_000333 [Quercus rubra]